MHETGLTSPQADTLLRQWGENALPEPRQAGVAEIFIAQFANPFIYILLAAAAVSALLGQIPSTVFIVAVLLINAVIGTVQEFSAQRAASALRSLVQGHATVLRDGERVAIDVRSVVPGDVIFLESGAKVPADADLIEAKNLIVDESMLTGESEGIEKKPGEDSEAPAQSGDRTAAVFAGSVVLSGRAEARVTATGLNTEVGGIAASFSEPRHAEPPLVRRIRRFTRTVAVGIIGAIVLLVAVMLAQGGYASGDMMLMSVGLAVSAIPEGLPAALTVALAIGMNRMARRNVIIRRLVAVEALGSCSIICSDKTGTLTVNELTVKQVVLPTGDRFEIGGEGLSPDGEILGPDERLGLRLVARTGLLANEARLIEEGGDWHAEGDSVDAALLVLGRKAGYADGDLARDKPVIAELPYESEVAWSGALNDTDLGPLLSVKGSVEKLLPMCDRMFGKQEPVPVDGDYILSQATALAREGFRVLAMAAAYPENDTLDEVPRQPAGLVFLGLVAMIDPLRPEATGAVARCRRAGIEVAMITGDHPETARTLALQLGILDADDAVVSGSQLRATEEADRAALISRTRVFARIEPDQKRQIVETLMAQGHFVAVTGDGVNDAPALRHSNVGVAMGRRGTDLARETADLIITDDNFASIVNGVEEGRIVFNNIRKVIALLISTGVSAILLFFLCALTGQPMPLTAVQLLWLNLVANGVQDVALAFEPAEGNELGKPPRRSTERIFNRPLLTHVGVNGIWMGAVAFLVFQAELTQGMVLEEARNTILMLMILFGNVHSYNSRSESGSVFGMNPIGNPFLLAAIVGAQTVHIAAMYVPFLSSVLEINPIDAETWFRLLAIAATLFVVDETAKWFERRRERQ